MATDGLKGVEAGRAVMGAPTDEEKNMRLLGTTGFESLTEETLMSRFAACELSRNRKCYIGKTFALSVESKRFCVAQKVGQPLRSWQLPSACAQAFCRCLTFGS